MSLFLVEMSNRNLYFIFDTEAAAKTGMILLLGEITSKGVVDYQKIVRDTVQKIGYDDTSKGNCKFLAVNQPYICNVQ